MLATFPLILFDRTERVKHILSYNLSILLIRTHIQHGKNTWFLRFDQIQVGESIYGAFTTHIHIILFITFLSARLDV